MVAAMVFATATSAAAADLYVDDDDVTCGGNAPCYSTIQAAINAAAVSGDTIHVRPGTYTENLVLGKSLTILGAQAGIGACACRAGESTVTAASGTLLLLQTGSAGSVIDGLTFSGGARGIESNTGPINNLQLLNNRVIGFTGNGVFLNDPGTDITVNQNSIDGSSKIGGGGLFHLDTDNFDGFHLTNNCISNGLTGTGFFVDGNHNVGESATRDPLISGNTINNNGTGMNLGTRAFGENALPASTYGGTISNNTFSNNTFDGLQGGIQHVLVSGNTFSGNGRHGLALTSFGNTGADRGAQNSLISCNTFTGNGFTNAGSGILFSSTQAAGTIGTNQAHLNNISGNNIGATYAGTETIDAENNWWGSATGPTIASNPGGTGDSIVNASGGLDYTPFLSGVASCATLATSPGNQRGWVAAGSAAGGVVQFVSGPAIPPLGTGSLRIFTGTEGDASREFRNPDYNGTNLSTLTALGYCTHVTSWNGQQVPYLILRVDRDNNGTIDDLLFFEPTFSDGSFNPAIPAQPTPVLNTWQCWNALKGGWYGLDATTFAGSFGSPGAGVLPFTNYTTAFPSAVLRNSTSGVTGAIRLLSGFASATDVFDSNSDAFQIGVGGTLTTYNFEASQPTAMNETAGDNQGTLLNTPFPIDLQVTVTDEAAAGVPNIPVTFTAPLTGASGTFAGGCLSVTVLTDASGVATAPQFTANGQAGYYIVTATAPNLPTADFNLRNMISPTAANATVDGRITSSAGEPIAGVVVALSGSQTRKTITNAKGYYYFENVDTTGFYTVKPLRANYNFSPSERSFSQLGNHTEAGFTGSVAGDAFNPVDTAEYFVRQQYLDILGREPDEGGFNYWSDEINKCGSDLLCIRRRRIDVAAAFFVEREFQDTGSYIYELYTSSLGRKPRFAEYAIDRRQVVGGPQLEAQKAAFAEGFVQRTEFLVKYQAYATAETFVDALLQNVQQGSGVNLGNQRETLLAAYNTGGSMTQGRALVMQTVADNALLKKAEYNAAFVLTEYFSYLRRDPEPEGYAFWLNVLTTADVGNYQGMVCSFITSAEYQQRFSANVTHTNGECGN
ncbi:MAG: DUF4214 domain-containing protein [Pyrinomonadaceae bacterium]